MGAWPGTWALYGRRGGVAGPLGVVWFPGKRGLSPGTRIAAVDALPVPSATYGHRGGVAGFLGPVLPL